jgi:hypothetical protein
VGHLAVGAELDAEAAFGGEGEAVVGGFAVDDELRAFGGGVGEEGAGGVALFADDVEEGDALAGGDELFGGGDLGGDDSLGVAGAAAVEEVGVFAAGAEEGWDGVHVRGEDEVGGDAGERGVDVEALAGAGGGVLGEVGLGDGLALDDVTLGGEVGGEELAGRGLVVGGGLEVDKLLRELRWDRWASGVRITDVRLGTGSDDRLGG